MATVGVMNKQKKTPALRYVRYSTRCAGRLVDFNSKRSSPASVRILCRDRYTIAIEARCFENSTHQRDRWITTTFGTLLIGHISAIMRTRRNVNDRGLWLAFRTRTLNSVKCDICTTSHDRCAITSTTRSIGSIGVHRHPMATQSSLLTRDNETSGHE